jgi:non-ribosomal peptide synthetase component E (peptide arylation enzyme)
VGLLARDRSARRRQSLAQDFAGGTEIQDFLKEKDIAEYKMPKKLVTVPALTRNPVGKVLKGEIRRQLDDHRE